MERPRPRPKHRSFQTKSARNSLHTTNKQNMERPQRHKQSRSSFGSKQLMKNEDELLMKLSKIEQHQKWRKSEFDKIVLNEDEMKENVASLQLIGIRNVSSLYNRHSLIKNKNKNNHNRAQSTVVCSAVHLPKYQHLRSISSIMGFDTKYISQNDAKKQITKSEEMKGDN